jgi:FlaA1/EpsC-like NDP-sugar epimerase
VSIREIRELDIDELLGRGHVAPDMGLFGRDIQGKTVLVTGAGGSIGSELCRQILSATPLRLNLLDHSQYSLYKVNQELIKLYRVRGGFVTDTDFLVPVLG